ncbi:hypothetical protein EK21DRAFT_118683, partial [Setomelanomma holmii]
MQPQPQLQRPSQDKQLGDQPDEQYRMRQAEQYGVRQDVQSHSYPPQEPQWHTRTQRRPPATAYCKVTLFPQQPTSRVPDRPPNLPHNPYKTLPPQWSCNDQLDANIITQFSKLWDNSNKYTGNAYDLLDDKIKVFFSICWQVDIQEEQFHAVFPRILTGRAETFYIQVVERDDSFASAYTAIKNHFDHDVHHQHYYTDWTTTTFACTRTENPDKGLHEVLQILLDKLQLCQRALGKNFDSEDALRTTVINACHGVLELKMALFKPATIYEGLFSDLRFKPRWRKKCFVCQKEGCWSTNHTDEERKAARAQFFSACHFTGGQPPIDFSRGWREEEDCEDSDNDNSTSNQQYLEHYRGAPSAPASQFLLKDRYTRSVYQGILPDTGAANVSTVGKEQYLALTREDPTVKMDTSTAGKASIKFGKGSATASIGTAQVSTDIGTINFEVLDAPTPFLLCLADMDRLKVYFNNTTDELVQGNIRIPVLRKWGHPWFHLNKRERATVFLTETELRRLHRRFGHPAVMRLAKLLKDAGHDNFEERTLEEVTKFCHHCQLHSSAPRQFKFTLKDDHHFNYEILVDVMYLSSKPVLHVVDSSTAFQGAKFLNATSAKETWQALRMLWIDTYQGPPDIITHDAGTNFASAEFRAEAKIMGVTCKQVPTEAHWSVGKTERYHAPLRRAWDILHAELSDAMSDEAILQMAVKA